MVLNAHARDTVSGDLLEEYRQSIVPALGRDADSWYVRQMTRYVLHQTWMWGVLVAVIFVTPHVVPLRSALMHWVPLRAVLNGTLTAALSLFRRTGHPRRTSGCRGLRRVQPENEQRVTSRDGDVLFVAGEKRHRP
jgi:hypothetical protein